MKIGISVTIVIGLAIVTVSGWAMQPLSKVQDTFAFAVYGDCRTQHNVHRGIVKHLLATKPSFLLTTGDQVASGDRESDWAIFNDITKELRAQIHYYPAKGNHDLDKGTGLYAQNFPMKTNTGTILYYSFSQGNCYFAVVDSNTILEDDDQLEWLNKDLKASKAKHKFVALHHPPFTLMPKRERGATLVRKRLHALFQEAEVCAVFCGHDHYFYRTIRNNIHYITTGGGGAPLYNLDPSRAQVGDAWGKFHHFVLANVELNSVHATVKDQEGRLRIHFEICKHP